VVIVFNLEDISLIDGAGLSDPRAKHAGRGLGGGGAAFRTSRAAPATPSKHKKGRLQKMQLGPESATLRRRRD